MDQALYNSEAGYYTTQVRFGQSGDFSTSPVLDPTFGNALGRWAWSDEPYPRNRFFRNIIEIGGGNGALAGSLLENLPWHRRLRTRYHLVDSSPALQKEQQKHLRRYSIQWHESPQTALQSCQGEAIILSNELVDAFPIHLLEWDGREWKEVYINQPGNEEQLRPCESEFDSVSMNAWPPSLPLKKGQRIEIHQRYKTWLTAWAAKLKSGCHLTIDYGDRFPEIYRRRPRGTLRAYFKGLVFEGAEIYERKGRQDVTADVNFSDLERWGEQVGFQSKWLSTQADFLNRWFPVSNPTPKTQFLRDPDGAGSAFKFLLQTKGI